MVYTPTGDANINPYGAVPIFDSENPCSFTGVCAQTVSGGQFVMISGTLGTIFSSGADSYAVTDLAVCPAILYDNVGGLALQTVASGTTKYVSVARKGCFLVQASDAVSGGAPVCFASGGVAHIWSASAGSGTTAVPNQYQIGRALSSADSGGYCLVALNL
jgi:hypothetical protein